MAIPSVKPNSALNSLNEINALAYSMLKRKYYGPNIESEINNRNELTRGQKITNEYLPDKLRLANNFSSLRNKYYGPNIESEINNRNELTRGQKITNEYLPDKLRLANAFSKLHNQYYGPNIESEINNRNASTTGKNIENQYLPEKLKNNNQKTFLENQFYIPKTKADIKKSEAITNKINTMTPLEAEKAVLENKFYTPEKRSQIKNRNSVTKNNEINNKYLDEKLQYDNAIHKFKKENPLLALSGTAQQVGALNYIRQHPELFNNNQIDSSMRYQPGKGYAPYNEEKIPSKKESDLENMLQQSIVNGLESNKKGTAQTKEFKNAKGYEDAKNGFIPFTNRTQKIENEEQRQRYMKALGLESSDNKKALENFREKSLNRKHWDGLTPDTKAHLVAIAQGAGIRGDEVEKKLSSGESFDDLLYDHGYDPKHPPEPIFELTAKNRSALNEREYASREVKYLSNFINDATGDYANRVKGYSTRFIKDSLLGKNEKQQAKFLSAVALSPELINLRLTLGGARSTVHAIKSMGEKSMLNVKVFESLVSNKVWHDMQSITDKELQKAFEASKSGYGQPKVSKKMPTLSNGTPDFSKMTDEELHAMVNGNG